MVSNPHLQAMKRPFGRGPITPFRGLTITMVINHLACSFCNVCRQKIRLCSQPWLSAAMGFRYGNLLTCLEFNVRPVFHRIVLHDLTTLPKQTSIFALKMVVSNRNLLFPGVYFQGRTVSFREGICRMGTSA